MTVYDNFSSGREVTSSGAPTTRASRSFAADVKDLETLIEAARGHDAVVHLASNPDIARAATEPSIDFDEGTLLTHHVLEAMRVAGVERILYASGSGVYGDLGETEADEDWGPLVPISTYGASKLAGEALISAYSFMFGLSGRAFRFGNVVGPRQTHGVGFDFVRALLADPTRLRILGDGTQSKSYIHVDDVIDAMLAANRQQMGPTASTTSRRATTSRSRRSPTWPRSASASSRRTSGTSTRAANAVGRATYPWFGSRSSASAVSAGHRRARPGRRCASR